jgi:hypothetical protein
MKKKSLQALLILALFGFAVMIVLGSFSMPIASSIINPNRPIAGEFTVGDFEALFGLLGASVSLGLYISKIKTKKGA